MMDLLAGLPAWAVLLVVFALPAAESGLLVGVFVPGETAVLVGGAVAHASGSLSLWEVVVAASLGAAVGDQAGFEVGRRYGDRLAAHLPARVRRAGGLERTASMLRRRGGAAVVLGRWVAVVRAVLPGAAGASGMARSRFTVLNVLGGVLWALTVASAGYLAGASYRALERYLGLGADALLVVLVAVAVVVLLRHRRR